MTIDEAQFETLAENTLKGLMEAIEAQAGDEAEVDLIGGVLTVVFDDGATYVLNKHAVSRQIWLSSPQSGASHYAYDGDRGRWIGTRGGEVLEEVLGRDLSASMGADVRFG